MASPLGPPVGFPPADVVMEGGAGAKRRTRRFRPIAEKRRIVELTLEPGASMAVVARAYAVNANQVFSWRRAFERGELTEPAARSTALLPVTVSAVCEPAVQESVVPEQPAPPGSTHIEFPGRTTISVEFAAGPALLRAALVSLRS